jgi:hypothetical protein
MPSRCRSSSPLAAYEFKNLLDVQALSGGGLEAAYSRLHTLMAAALGPLEGLALQLEAETGERYIGLDSSICPALERPNMAGGLGRWVGHHAGALQWCWRMGALLALGGAALCSMEM